MPWERISRIGTLLERLKEESVFVYAVEQTKNALPYTKAHIKKTTAFIFGNEVKGLSSQILKQCDSVIHIPMRGRKESLNVAVAAGVILFRILAP